MKAEPTWDKWCTMKKGKEVHVEGVRIKRKGSIVWIAGKCARTVRQVGRAERVTLAKHGGYAQARDETGKGMKGRGEGRRSIGVGGSRE